MPKTSQIRSAISTEHQLVTDRQTDRHRAIASTMLEQCHAGENDVFMCVMFVFVIRISCYFSQWHTIRVRRYQKKHSPAHTQPDHQTHPLSTPSVYYDPQHTSSYNLKRTDFPELSAHNLFKTAYQARSSLSLTVHSYRQQHQQW